VRISEIARFELQSDKPSLEDAHLPLIVHLKSGQKLCGIDGIIICTGYHITLPFLQEYHDDETSPADANETVLVTDGTQVHNLHKDIFYIPDPTLVFVGVPYYTATFTLFLLWDCPAASHRRDEGGISCSHQGEGEWTGIPLTEECGGALRSGYLGMGE
jgi:hypothetical protein